MTSEVLGEDTVSAAVSAALDADVLAIERIAGSVTNQDFGVDLADGRRVLVKIGPRAELTAEVWALGRAAAAGVPVPGVLGYQDNTAELPTPFVILEWIANDGSPNDQALQTAGAAIRSAHAIELAGYGPIDVVGNPLAPSSVAGRYARWSDYIAVMLEDLEVLLGAGLLTSQACVQIRRHTDGLEASPLAGSSGSLLHSDLKAPHILTAEGRLAAIIDWGDASVGDPAWDLARASMMDDAAYRVLAGSYRGADQAQVVQLLPIYRVLWNVRSLAWEYSAGGDWFAEYQRRITQDLASL